MSSWVYVVEDYDEVDGHFNNAAFISKAEAIRYAENYVKRMNKQIWEQSENERGFHELSDETYFDGDDTVKIFRRGIDWIRVSRLRLMGRSVGGNRKRKMLRN